MTESIWKYTLDLRTDQTLEMPAEPRVLAVGFQRGQLCVWAWVRVDAPKVFYDFHVVGTGHPAPSRSDPRHYAGTAVSDSLVWHVWTNAQVRFLGLARPMPLTDGPENRT